MGVAGWTELQDNVTLVGTATANAYSGHDDVFNPLEDWDWSLFVSPAPSFENLAINRGGVRNDNGIIECEIQPPDGFLDGRTMHRFLDPMLRHTVTVVGTWVEDISHNNKTEIHPITSILHEIDGIPGLLYLEKTFEFLGFCDTSTPHQIDPPRPHIPPHANELRVAQFQVRFPRSIDGLALDLLDPAHFPAFTIEAENDRSLHKSFAIVARSNDIFLTGAVQVNRSRGFYFGRFHLTSRQTNTQHVFGRNAAGELIHYYWSPQPGWAAENLTHYPNIGAALQIASDPRVINLQAGDIPTQHVFGRNAAGELIHYYWSPQPGWAAENLTHYPNIGAALQIASDPRVINLTGDIPTQHVFGRNAAGELIHYYWSPQPGWAAENLTHHPNIGAALQIASDPRVINLTGDIPTQHVFGRNAAGELIHYYWSPQPGWAAENLTHHPNIGAALQIASDPRVINLTGDIPTQHVFGRNAAGELIHYYWSPQPGWAAENLTHHPNIGAALQIASDPRVINLQAGDIPTQHVFGRNAAGELIHYYWSPQPGWAAENLTHHPNIGAALQIASDPRVINLQAGDIPTQHVFGRNAAGELIHYYWSPQPGWAAENLTHHPNIGAALQIASDPRVINLQAGDIPTQHVFGRNAAGELIHYYWSPQPGWAAENLTHYPNIGAALQIASDPRIINL